MTEFIDFFLHLDKHLETFFIEYQALTYFLVCLVLFCETGLIVTPFLPGDSLLFAVGATIAKIGILRLEIMIPLMLISVILGDNVNYFVGNKIGKRLFETNNTILKKILKPEYLTKTENFYTKYGGRTVIMARFVPIVRTFAPFVAGIGAMNFRKYIGYCVAGALLWVLSITLAGYFLGQIPIIKNNFEIVVISIILISIMPAVFQVIKEKRKTTV